ncbi:MAG: DNA polymerase III subunit beta [Wenzhouxiangellaceae bacterium]
MKVRVERELMLPLLNLVVGVVERRQTLPVLANLLLHAEDGKLTCTGTDMEVELTGSMEAEIEQDGEITVPARKLHDICRALPDGALIRLELKDDKMSVSSGRSRFTLSTLPAEEFPSSDQVDSLAEWSFTEDMIHALMTGTSFAMAHQDVRYYLNGLMLEFKPGMLRAVATDGHRLALSDLNAEEMEADERQLIVPRKGILELMRMLGHSETPVQLAVGRSHIRLRKDGLQLTSKLIDGRFPDYEAVIPVGNDRMVIVQRQELREALQRAAILSNEKYRGVRLELEPGSIRIIAHNPQQEEAVDEVEAEHDIKDLSMGFNVTYLQDALNVIDSERVRLALRDANSSCLITAEDSDANRHVIMPLKL